MTQISSKIEKESSSKNIDLNLQEKKNPKGLSILSKENLMHCIQNSKMLISLFGIKFIGSKSIFTAYSLRKKYMKKLRKLKDPLV